MVANVGRTVSLTWNAQPAGGVREKAVAFNGEPIDVTSDEDDGWRTLLLTDLAERSVNLSLSGVTKDDTLRQAWASGNYDGTAVLTYPDGATLTGTFVMGQFTETAPYNDAMTFQVELQSTGPVTYLPAASP